MTDDFDSEVQKFVARQNGDDLTPRIVYQMLLAMHRDMQRGFADLGEKFDGHCVEAELRDDRIEALERFERHATDRCAAAVQKQVAVAIEKSREEERQEHKTFHEATFGAHEKEENSLRELVDQMMASHRVGDPEWVDVESLRAAFSGTLEDQPESHESWLMRLVATTIGKILLVFLTAMAGAAAVEIFHAIQGHP